MEHVDAPPGEIHKPHNYEFADATARAVDSGYAASDVGKLALQLSDHTYWSVKSVGPLVWEQMGGYTHPASHPPSIITQDATNRFVTDAEKTAWNAKQPAGSYADATHDHAGVYDPAGSAAAAQGASTPIAHATDTANPHAVTKTQVGLGNVDDTSDADKPVSTAQATAIGLKIDTAAKDASGGVPGLTLFKLNLRNALNTLTSWFTTAATAPRTWTMPDKDGTVALLSDVASTVVGGASIFYLDTTASLADNFTLSVSPSSFAEIVNSKTVLVATSPVFMERFVSGALGRTSIPAGTWEFNTFAATDSDTGTNEIKFRINRRTAITGVTGTFTGAGPTRTFTATGGTPFVAGDANASSMLASLIETPTQTAWISGYTSSTEVTVTLTDAGFVNVSNVELSAIYYLLFSDTTGDITGATPTVYNSISVQPEFTGFSETDRLAVAYFASSDSDVGTDTMRLYYGGTQNFSHFHTPISTKHNDFDGLNDGDYKHLTAAEKTAMARIDTSQTFTGAQIGSVTALTSSAASMAINLALGNHFTHTTSENTTLAAPSNPVAGQSGVIVITQGAAARLMAYNTFWKFPGGTIPTLTETIGAVDVLAYYVESGSRATCQLLKDVK